MCYDGYAVKVITYAQVLTLLSILFFVNLICTNFYLSTSSQLPSKRGNEYFWGMFFLVYIIYNISIAENVLCY